MSFASASSFSAVAWLSPFKSGTFTFLGAGLPDETTSETVVLCASGVSASGVCDTTLPVGTVVDALYFTSPSLKPDATIDFSASGNVSDTTFGTTNMGLSEADAITDEALDEDELRCCWAHAASANAATTSNAAHAKAPIFLEGRDRNMISS